MKPLTNDTLTTTRFKTIKHMLDAKANHFRIPNIPNLNHIHTNVT